MENPEKTLKQIMTEIEQGVAAYNDAVKKNDMKAANVAEQMLKASEAEYLEHKQHEVFCALKAQEKPMLAAVRQYSFPVVKHRAVKEGGVVLGIELIERERQIDLVKLSKFCELDTTWALKVELFGQLLCMRSAKELNMSAAEVRQIANTYYMSELARKEKLGETPMSNTQVVKALQAVIDSFLFEAGGNGANIYKVNNYDANYLLMCYTKRGKGMLSVQVAKAGFVHSLILDVCHRIVTGKVYNLEFKQMKEKAEPMKAAEPKKSAKKAEKTEVTEIPLPQKETDAA